MKSFPSYSPSLIGGRPVCRRAKESDPVALCGTVNNDAVPGFGIESHPPPTTVPRETTIGSEC